LSPAILIVVVLVILVPVMIIRLVIRRGRAASGSGAVQTELVRINERLTSIEKVLRDIE